MKGVFMNPFAKDTIQVEDDTLVEAVASALNSSSTIHPETTDIVSANNVFLIADYDQTRNVFFALTDGRVSLLSKMFLLPTAYCSEVFTVDPFEVISIEVVKDLPIFVSRLFSGICYTYEKK